VNGPVAWMSDVELTKCEKGESNTLLSFPAAVCRKEILPHMRWKDAATFIRSAEDSGRSRPLFQLHRGQFRSQAVWAACECHKKVGNWWSGLLFVLSFRGLGM